jgi:chorismate dehydratase
MTPVRLGAVSYLNARPCVVGLDRDPRFEMRFDLPSRCASLLHAGSIDVGLIPSIEYLRGPGGPGGYLLVPDVAIVSTGAVASVALYTTRPMSDVRSIALDTSSRTSVALTRVLCARAFHINPALEPLGPDVPAMLERCDAALLIGDSALLLDLDTLCKPAATMSGSALQSVEKVDLGETWTKTTGLPFVYAFWAGRPDALSGEEVGAVQAARDAGVAGSDRVAKEYFSDPSLRSIGMRYLRDNIKYHLGEEELAGLDAFYQYAAELNLVPEPIGLRFYETGSPARHARAERLVRHK